MKHKVFKIAISFLILVMSIISSCTTKKSVKQKHELREYGITLFDTTRKRQIPLYFYNTNKWKQKVIIFNHGYGKNNPESYKTYSTICKHLAQKGYFVLSIQHELPGDEALAMEGIFYETRMPNWERGVQNIKFVIEECEKIFPTLNWKDITVIGHSNGGDMAMLFAAKYPDYIKNAISLDNRRMPLPRVARPRILSLRGSDLPADPGVLPSNELQEELKMRIINLKNIRHSDMDDKGTTHQLQTINNYIIDFLNGK
ncbi:alpha/beta fold hydrolase [Flavobacterium oreochromis]|uniref:alpha/beta fold hydrolase n=1 Tax=Flavobacterium oreochromis TaxID=2906078 RepID=UPI00385FA975